MAYLYQQIMNVPGLSGSSYDRQKQLYERLGSPQGPYRGSYSQNIWLQQQVQSGNTGVQAAASAPAETPEQAIIRQEREAQEAAAAETAREKAKWEGAINDLQGYIKKYNYDDVLASQDSQYTDFLNSASQGQEYQWQDPEGDGISGIGPEYLNMLKLSAQKYQPEYQRKNEEHRQDLFNQATDTQNQYESQYDNLTEQYAAPGAIRGGMANAGMQKTTQTQGDILNRQQQGEQRFQGEQKQQRIEDVLGLAKEFRKQYIDQYRNEIPANYKLSYGGNYTDLQNQYSGIKS